MISSEVHDTNICLRVWYSDRKWCHAVCIVSYQGDRWVWMWEDCSQEIGYANDDQCCKMYKMSSNMLICIAWSTVFALHCTLCRGGTSVSVYTCTSSQALADWQTGNTTEIHTGLQTHISTPQLSIQCRMIRGRNRNGWLVLTFCEM